MVHTSEGQRSTPASNAARGRWFALAIGSVLAIGLGWMAWRMLRSAREQAGFDREAIEALLRQRSAESGATTAVPRETARRPEDRAWYVPPADAAKIFEVLTRINQYDPWCYYAHRPNLEYETNWPEHPRQRWTYHTNSRGLRNDREVLEKRPDLRVVVTGDSHTEGFCDNADSFSGRLEAALGRRFEGSSVEVLNAADLAYSFYNYIGVLEKFVELEPHVFVVTVHGGNDFREALLPYRYFARMPLPAREDFERSPSGSNADIFVPASHQGLLSISYFREHPAEKDSVSRATSQVFSEMQRICKDHGIALLCVYLPSPVEIEKRRLAELLEPSMRAFGVTETDIDAHAEWGRSLMREIVALGVTVLDLTDTLRATPSPAFWREDLHLNLLGHEAVARAIEPLIVRLAGR